MLMMISVAAPLTDGHWVRASRPLDPTPLTNRHKLSAVLVVTLVVAAVVIEA